MNQECIPSRHPADAFVDGRTITPASLPDVEGGGVGCCGGEGEQYKGEWKEVFFHVN